MLTDWDVWKTGRREENQFAMSMMRSMALPLPKEYCISHVIPIFPIPSTAVVINTGKSKQDLYRMYSCDNGVSSKNDKLLRKTNVCMCVLI